jgi:fucose permease
LTAFTPTFLTAKGLSVGYANAISAGMMSIGIIGTFVIGSSLDRYGERRVILFTTSTILTTSIIIFALDEVQYIIPLVFIMGFPLLGMGPPYYSLISRKTELKDQTSAYAVVLSMAWGIGGLFPYLEGALSDIFGINAIFLVVAISALVSIIISYFWVRASPG